MKTQLKGWFLFLPRKIISMLGAVTFNSYHLNDIRDSNNGYREAFNCLRWPLWLMQIPFTNCHLIGGLGRVFIRIRRITKNGSGFSRQWWSKECHLGGRRVVGVVGAGSRPVAAEPRCAGRSRLWRKQHGYVRVANWQFSAGISRYDCCFSFLPGRKKRFALHSFVSGVI